MAVVDVEQVTGTSLEISTDSEGKQSGKYATTFMVTVDDDTTSLDDCISACGVSHSLGAGGLTLYCNSQKAELIAHGIVQVSFSWNSDTRSWTSPLDMPTQWEESTWDLEIAPEKDFNGNALVNSASRPFVPPITIVIPCPVVIARKNFSSISTASYSGFVNSSSVSLNGVSYSTGTVLCKASKKQEYDAVIGAYESAEFQFVVRPSGLPWRPWKKLDEGFQYKDSSGKYHDFVDDMGNLSPVPGLLKSDGDKLATGGTPNYKDFVLYGQANFGAIGL